MEHLLQQLALIHPMLEPLGRWIIIIVVISIFWLVLSVPSAILHYAISKYLLRAYEFFMLLRDKVWASARQMAIGLGAAKQKFINTSRLTLVLDYYDREIRNIVLKAKQKLEQTDKRIALHANGFEDNVLKIEKGSEEIILRANQFAGSVQHKTELNVPEINTVVKEATLHREGATKLIIGLLGGLALIIINTFLLNQFFESFISMRVFGLRISMILSLFFSFLEAVLGIVLYFQQRKLKQEDIRHHLGEMMIFTLIALLMTIEFVLYMVLSGQMDQDIFVNMFAPDPVPAYFRYWLAPFGFVVVGVLAFCGHLFIEGLHMFLQTTVLGSIDKRIEKYDRLTRGLNKGFENIHKLADKLKQGLESYIKDLRGIEKNKPLIAEEVINSVHELTGLVEEADKERGKPDSVKNIDVENSYYQYIFYGAATLIVTGLFVWSQVNFLNKLQLFDNPSYYLYLAIALAEAVILLAVGFAFSKPRLMVMEEGATAVIETPVPRWLIVILGVIVIGLLAFNVFLILKQNTTNEWSWLMLMVACIGALIYFGRNLKHILSACWCFLGTVACALSLIVPTILAVLCHVVSWLAKIADVLIETIAYPTIKLRQYFMNRKQPGPATNEMKFSAVQQDAQ